MTRMQGTDRHERRDVQRNMERVLRAAQELFAERGPEVRMEEVARRAGVGVGTIYRRFPSKEHLFAAVSQAACEDMRHCVAQAAEDACDPVAKLRAIIVAHYHQSLRQVHLLEPSAPDDERAGEADQPGIYAALHGLLSGVIAAGQAQGHFRAGDPAILAAMVLELLSPRAVQRICRVTDCCDGAAEQVAGFVLSSLCPDGLMVER